MEHEKNNLLGNKFVMNPLGEPARLDEKRDGLGKGKFVLAAISFKKN